MILSSKRPPMRMYITIVVLCTISMIIYTFPDALDITDYYEIARETAATGISVSEYVLFNIAKYVDFLYHTMLLVAVRYGVPLNVITITFLSLYYILMIEIVRKNFHGAKIEGYVFLFSLLSCSFVWVQEVPRTLTAIVFIYAAVLSVYGEKKIFSVLFLLLAFFSHAGSSVIFFACIAIAFFLNKKKLGKTAQIAVLIATLVISLVSPDSFIKLIMGQMGNMDNHYAVYADKEINGIFSYSSIGYGDRISAVMTFVYTTYLIVVSKKQNLMYWIFYTVGIASTFCLFTNYSVFMRLNMFIPLFITYVTTELIKDKGIKSNQGLLVLSVIGLLVFVLELYSYRPAYGF